MNTALIRKESIEELCGHRARATELYQAGLNMIREARRAHAMACPTKTHIAAFPDRIAYDLPDFDKPGGLLAKLTKDLDRDMWRSLIMGSPLGSLMDKQERTKFEEGLEKNPPEVTPETALATMEQLAGDADMIFRRGLVTAFKGLCREYASNDGFKVGERTVITWGVTYGKPPLDWFHVGRHAEDTLRDIDRVVHVLDGKPTPEYGQGLAGMLAAACRNWKTNGTEFRTPYWRVKFHKNGTVHLWLLDDDLRAQVNRIIAEHFGEVLGAGRDVAGKRYNPVGDAGKFGAADRDFFPTPAAAARRLIDLAELEEGMTVLEPSAGLGAIAAPALLAGCLVDCIEVDARRVGILCSTPFRRVAETDFLTTEVAGKYDRVLMNPPFSRGQDVKHVLHALDFLKPGGRMVAILPSGFTTNSGKLYVEARKRMTASEPLPEGSFEAAGTMVRTIVATFA